MVTLSVRQKAEMQDMKHRLRDREEEIEALREEIAATKDQLVQVQASATTGVRHRPHVRRR